MKHRAQLAGLIGLMLLSPASGTGASGADGESISVRTLGTGAADYDWENIGKPGVKGSTSTLLDGRILLDCGVTGMANLTRFGVSPDALEYLVITHSHRDHCDTKNIAELLRKRTRKEPLAIVASEFNLERIAKLGLPFRAVPGKAGVPVPLGAIRLTPLPANHPVHPDDTPFHYLLETPCGNLLYALDGAWMTHAARSIIGERKLDMVIWDATMSQPGDWRIFEHNDLDMIALLEKSLRNGGVLKKNSVILLDHTAKTLWPEDAAAARKLAAGRGWILAEDGMEFRLRRAADE